MACGAAQRQRHGWWHRGGASTDRRRVAIFAGPVTGSGNDGVKCVYQSRDDVTQRLSH